MRRSTTKKNNRHRGGDLTTSDAVMAPENTNVVDNDGEQPGILGKTKNYLASWFGGSRNKYCKHSHKHYSHKHCKTKHDHCSLNHCSHKHCSHKRKHQTRKHQTRKHKK